MRLRLGGWISILLLFVVMGLGGVCYYLWGYYVKSTALERELEEAQRTIRSNDIQVLGLMGKLQSLESDIQRVKQFDAKLRVLMDVEKDQGASVYPEPEGDAGASGAGAVSNPHFFSRHRELFIINMHSLVDDLATNIRLEEVEQQTLVDLMRGNKDFLVATPSIWPAKGYITSGFGPRRAPLAGATSMHTALDIANVIGTPVIAPARGIVTFSGMDGAYGICIVLDHGGGIQTRYAHLSKSSVSVGQLVQRTEVIGAIGNTGRSTGPHLHYEVIVNGTKVNPMRYILN